MTTSEQQLIAAGHRSTRGTWQVRAGTRPPMPRPRRVPDASAAGLGLRERANAGFEYVRQRIAEAPRRPMRW